MWHWRINGLSKFVGNGKIFSENNFLKKKKTPFFHIIYLSILFHKVISTDNVFTITLSLLEMTYSSSLLLLDLASLCRLYTVFTI